MKIGENDLVFAKIKNGAIIPSKREEDAGYDVFACFDEDFMYFKPHQTRLVPTGIASALNPKYYIQIEERGSTGSKGIKKSAGIIDSGYRGEWFIAITNVNDVPMIIAKDTVTNKDIFGDINMNHIIYPYNKAIAQAIVHEVHIMNITELSYQELLLIESERGTGSLGSSKK
jgi:dUTP pyrophosphatase